LRPATSIKFQDTVSELIIDNAIFTSFRMCINYVLSVGRTESFLHFSYRNPLAGFSGPL
jgi:hypothetical protein